MSWILSHKKIHVLVNRHLMLLKYFKWLYPGIKVKRWVFASLFGVLIVGIGAVFAVYPYPFVSGMCFFLDDLFHHMLADSKQKQYRRVFLWLGRFLRKLPDVRLDQRERAVCYIQDLYDVFGLHLNLNLQGGRK